MSPLPPREPGRLHPLDPNAVPAAARRVLCRLEHGGFEARLVGGVVRDLLLGRRVPDFDVATSAPPEMALELFPRAIPTGLRHGTVTVPTGAGPVDVTTYRAGPRLVDDLAHRDFTVNAMAWDVARNLLIDPFGGAADLQAGCLRAVGEARARIGEDPLRALRAARLVATRALEPDAELEAALREARPALRRVARERVRRELEALLLGPGVEKALDLLERTGLAAELVPGAAPDAPRVVAALPAQRILRLAGWLRATPDPQARLLQLRFPRRVAQAVGRLLRFHPIEAGAEPQSPAAVRRLLERVGLEDLPRAIALRRAELTAGSPKGETPRVALERLEALREAAQALERSGALTLRRSDLALDGRDVIRLLHGRPGPAVGAALRYLLDRVLEDPRCNTRERLRLLLQQWWSEHGAGEGAGSAAAGAPPRSPACAGGSD